MDVQEADLREQLECLLAEQDFIRSEEIRIRDRLLGEDDPPQPHVEAALLQALNETSDSFTRMKVELDVLRELAVELRDERDAMKLAFHEQCREFLDGTNRWIDSTWAVVKTVQSVRSGIHSITYTIG